MPTTTSSTGAFEKLARKDPRGCHRRHVCGVAASAAPTTDCACRGATSGCTRRRVATQQQSSEQLVPSPRIRAIAKSTLPPAALVLAGVLPLLPTREHDRRSRLLRSRLAAEVEHTSLVGRRGITSASRRATATHAH